MDTETHVDLIRQIVDPDPSNAAKLLQDMGLARPPSTEQVHREIEERFLLPKPSLPKHWLPHYQVCDETYTTLALVDASTGTGSLNLIQPHFCLWTPHHRQLL